MSLYLYNSLSKKKEEFIPINEKEITMYNCGPTVYFYASIGNYRSFLVADLLKRFLKFKGHQVKQVMNITDVGHMTSDGDTGEDKMEAQAKKEKKDPWEISGYYEKVFHEDIAKLNIDKADYYPKATEHVVEMIDMIKALFDKGYAYTANDSIYYDLSKFPEYGKLSGNTLDDLIAGKRVEINEDKRNPYDFALWIHNPKHIMQWDSPWGRGYPGWHLECSAMALKYLGESIDIHTGGEDNKFPHHECEIAQSEGANGKKFVGYWLHIKHLMVDGGKMSKSLGNVYTVSQIEEMGYSLMALRYFLMSGHYRQSLNFTFDGVKAAETAIAKLQNFIDTLRKTDNDETEIKELLNEARNNFEKCLDDDLNISGALAVIFEFVKKINTLIADGKISKVNAADILDFMKAINSVLGVLDFEEKQVSGKEQELIGIILKTRDMARKDKNWAMSDFIRDELGKIGLKVKDTKDGSIIDIE